MYIYTYIYAYIYTYKYIYLYLYIGSVCGPSSIGRLELAELKLPGRVSLKNKLFRDKTNQMKMNLFCFKETCPGDFSLASPSPIQLLLILSMPKDVSLLYL